jgi:hypothetical protein
MPATVAVDRAEAVAFGSITIVKREAAPSRGAVREHIGSYDGLKKIYTLSFVLRFLI